jgi:RHS repeat-associated protein
VTITPGSGQPPIEQDFAYDQLNRLVDAREYAVSASGSGIDSIGVYDPASGFFYLTNSNAGGGGDITPFSLGPGNQGWKPITGDWDGNGTDTVGVFDPASSTFHLINANASGSSVSSVQFGAGGAGFLPIEGDWDGNGTDTIGLYNPADGNFYLRNTNAGGGADLIFSLGPGGSDWQPVSGDWDNDGDDSVGIYSNNAGKIWYLRNDNTAGAADISIGFGQNGSNPITGDWNNDGTDTIGIYNPSPGNFFLRNENTPGNAHHTFQFGPGGGIGISGDWDGELATSETGNELVWRQEFTYDPWGNRSWGFGTTANALGPAVEIAPATNQLTSVGGQTCIYDAAGNMTDEGAKKFHFNAAGKMWKSETGATSTYVYDADGRRVKMTEGPKVTRFVYNAAGALVAEYTGATAPASPTKEYVYGPSGLLATVDSTGTRYVTPDHLGSTRIVTDAAKAVASRHDYFPFGEEIGAMSRAVDGYGQTGPRQKFTSYERDTETGLDFAQARYHSSTLGRFTSCDPLRASALPEDPQSWNRYTYVINNPLKFTDPSGLLPQDWWLPASISNPSSDVGGGGGGIDNEIRVVPVNFVFARGTFSKEEKEEIITEYFGKARMAFLKLNILLVVAGAPKEAIAHKLDNAGRFIDPAAVVTGAANVYFTESFIGQDHRYGGVTNWIDKSSFIRANVTGASSEDLLHELVHMFGLAGGANGYTKSTKTKEGTAELATRDAVTYLLNTQYADPIFGPPRPVISNWELVRRQLRDGARRVASP